MILEVESISSTLLKPEEEDFGLTLRYVEYRFDAVMERIRYKLTQLKIC